MKKNIFTLTFAIAICLINASIFAQTTAFIEFTKKANFLKESKKMGGYYCSTCSYGKPPEYEMNELTISILSVKRENENVVSFNIAYEGEYINQEIIPNDPESPTCWIPSIPHQNLKIVMYKDWVVMVSEDPAISDNFYISGWYKLGAISLKDKLKANMEIMNKKFVPPFTKEEIAADCKASVDAKKSSSANAKANADAKAAAHKEKFSIKGKKVTKIEVIATYPKDFDVQSKYSFGVAATLADGSQIKTKELGGEGYMEDYNIVVNNEKIINFYKEYEVGTQLNRLKGDYILIEASSIHFPTLAKASKKIILTYNKSLKFNYSGAGMRIDGFKAENLKIEIKNVKHSETGEMLLEYRIYTSKGLDKTIRIQPDQNLEILANGGNSGCNNGLKINVRGADAGNISLYVDPAVGDNYRLDYSNNGGKGGSDSRYLPAVDGRDGTFKKTVQVIK